MFCINFAGDIHYIYPAG